MGGPLHIRNRVAGDGAQRLLRLMAAAAPLALVLALVPAPTAVAEAAPPRAEPAARRVVSDQNGTITIREGDRVRVTLEIGDVRVRTSASRAVKYHLRVEAPAGVALGDGSPQQPKFQVTTRTTPEGALLSGRIVNGRSTGQFWVTLEIDAPRTSPLEIFTQGGSVDVGDTDARLVCDTAGGKIRVGRVGGSARLKTAGGDIVVEDVNGDLTAITGGGNILAGPVKDNATLQSAGGHIRVASVGGEAKMDTGGGNIFLERAGARLSANTRGGRILVGEASAGLDAHTTGGGIRVWRLSGPASIETAAGSILLAGVNSPVRATTASGGITALFDSSASPASAATPAVAASPAAQPGPGPRPPRAPRAPRAVQVATLGELECTGGDLVVFVPKDFGANVDAAIGGGDNFRIVVDPAIQLTITANETVSGKLSRTEGSMGGGGPLLRLRATSGNILLRPADAPGALAAPPVPGAPPGAQSVPVGLAPPAPTDMDAAAAALEKSVVEMQRELEVRQEALEAYAAAQEWQAMRMVRRLSWDQRYPTAGWVVAPGSNPAWTIEYDGNSDQLAQIQNLRERVASLLSDRVIISAQQMRSRLARRVDPQYPPKAREAGIEGPVCLRVAIARDGSIEDVQALSGNPLLAESAINAVRQWRYVPTVLNGKQVPVLTVLTVVFHRP